MAKNIAEICAIIVGGAWVLWTFLIKDWQTLQRECDVHTSLEWFDSPEKQDFYEVKFQVTAQNAGITKFEIARAELNAWVLPAPELAKPPLQRINLRALTERVPPTLSDSFTDGPEMSLLARYREKDRNEEAFHYLLKKEPNHWVLFVITLFDEKGRAINESAQWDAIGGRTSKLTVEKPATDPKPSESTEKGK